MKKGYDTYQAVNSMGMSQLDLILTVYRGAINLLNQAKGSFDEKNYEEGRDACARARKCVVHLYTTLDMDNGGEIAAGLGQVYAFMIEQIDLISAGKSAEQIDEVIKLLNTIKEGWAELKEKENLEKEKLIATAGRSDSEFETNQSAAEIGKSGITITA